MRNEGIGSWTARRARMTPERVAVIGDDLTLTYGDLDARCRRLAASLAAMGVTRGDRVAYLGKNDPRLLETLFAATSLGAIFVPLNWRLAAPELAYIVGDCGAVVLVHSAELGPLVGELRDGVHAGADVGAPAVAHLVGLGEQYDALVSGADAENPDEPIGFDEPAVIIYTSGTTGRPKGATLSHANITWNTVNTLIDSGFSGADVALVCAPLFHVAALNMVSMPTVMTGATVRVMTQFDAGEVLDEIDTHGVTVMFGVPAMFQSMALSPGWASADLSTFRRALCGGAPVPLATIQTYLERGIDFLQGYGMTETSPGALFLTADRSVDKAGSTGVPQFFTDVRVVRPDGTDVDPGEKGEVIVAGPNVMLGYWGLPDATAAAIDDDGWFRSGDIAVVDDEGFVTIVDRVKDMYISGGENVYPAEVEDAIYSHPAVAECAVIGIADERWGEVGRAVVVLRGDAEPVDEAALLAHLEGRLARYKIPRSVVFADELPRSGAGKVLKNLVRAAHGSVSISSDDRG